MHKFNLEIEIPDKDYCRGCPVKRTFLMCEMGYGLPNLINDKGIIRQPRPNICKQNDKEKTNNVV